jgi:radical SAM protein with 4Fe4S-binding SPASM domain
MEETLTFLAEMGVPTVGLNALIHSGRGLEIKDGLREEDLHLLLEKAKEQTTSSQQRMIWYTPTQYCHFNPLEANLGVKGCTAALYNMCIEPDGKVLPCQSYYTPLGDFLANSWESIWNHELAVQLRERKILPEACHDCAYLIECGGACPLARLAGAYKTPVPYLPEFEIMEK